MSQTYDIERTKLLVVIVDGRLDAVYASDPNVEVECFDWDCYEEAPDDDAQYGLGGNPELIDLQATQDKKSKGLVEVY